MAAVELTIPSDAAHVRTARQVAAAVARQSGLPDETLETVRLAVGEACGLMLRITDEASDTRIRLEIRDDDGLAVTLTAGARRPLAEATGPEAARHLAAVDSALSDPSPEPLPIGSVLALLGELAHHVDVRTGPLGVRLGLRWATVA